MFNKEEYKKALLPLIIENLDLKQEITINNLVDIAEILSSISGVTDPENINIIMIFLIFSKNKKTLSDVVNGELGYAYSQQLLELLQHTKYINFIKNDAKSIDFTLEPIGYLKFFAHINVLLEFYMAGIDIDPHYFHDYLAISDLLTNEEIFEKQLEHLEVDLQAYAENIGAKLEPHHKNLKKLATPDQYKPFDRQKILSGFLYQWAKDNQFNQNEYAKTKTLIPPHSFFKLLQEKIILKDEVNPRHGKWPHIIQWYVIIEENKKTHFLENEPNHLYQHLGDPQCQAKAFVFNWDEQLIINAFHAWDLLFDRSSYKDYRCPEKVTLMLKTDKANDKWPILSESIKRETEKSFKTKKKIDETDFTRVPYNKPK